MNIPLLVGNLGHLFVIIAFVAALVSALSYFFAARLQKKEEAPLIQEKVRSWKKFARVFFWLHGTSVIGVVVSLFYLIYNHHYEFYYVWNHSANDLPAYYMVSAFWEGQEGSFLLWIFWHVILGFILIRVNKFWEAPMMSVFALVQAFLMSMILGVVIFGGKLGSDPFITLWDAGIVPNEKMVPKDGTGLNPLLQNYWMVIHPPTLFLGFALTLVPFAYVIAGLWQGKYREWIRPALPWASVGGAVLGLGILMGGYWAYETLSFGGYWNWDPVENAVYVPWLILIASLHTMIAFKKSNTALKASIILNIATFVLILYSTFLTRSGILGNASVHSFTDLGLSGQLLIYLLTFTFLSIILAARHWKHIPTTQKELTTYSKEFWIFIGALTLCLAGFQVIISTSLPVFNKIAEALGFVSNLAPPEPEHYNKFQIWGAILIAIFSAIGQFLWWQKPDRKKIKNDLLTSLTLTLLFASLFIILSRITGTGLMLDTSKIGKPSLSQLFSGTYMQFYTYLLLFTAGVFSIVSNSTVLIRLLKSRSYKLSGGAISHIGIAMMLIGMMFSSGYSKVLTKNLTGKLRVLGETKQADDFNKNHVTLYLNQPTPIKGYQVTYKGNYTDVSGFPEYIKQTELLPVSNRQALVREPLTYKDKTYFKRGDTVSINPENVYYRLDYRDSRGKIFTLYPKVQFSSAENAAASPDIRRGFSRDLYTHLSSIYPDPFEGRQWKPLKEMKARVKDTLYINDYVAIFEGITPVRPDDILNVATRSKNLGVRAHITLLGKNFKPFKLEPVFLIDAQKKKNAEVMRRADVSPELGIRMVILNIDPKAGTFTFGVNTTDRKDHIVMKTMAKPLINVLWLGTLVLMFGFGIASRRRYIEFKRMRDKGME